MDPGSSEEYKSMSKYGMPNSESQKNFEKEGFSKKSEASGNFSNSLINEDRKNVDNLKVLGDYQNKISESSKNYDFKVKDDFGKKPIIYGSTNIKILEIYHPIFDSSQSCQIKNFHINEEAIRAIKENCPKVLKIIGIYGISSVMKKFLEIIFEEELTFFPQNEGVYLFFNPISELGVFAFITPNEEIYIETPIKSSNRLIAILRILTDLCTKIVACISEEIINNWYYEDNGASNPFKNNTGQGGHRILFTIDNIEREPILEEIKVINNNMQAYICQNSYQKKDIFTPSSDNLNFLFISEFESLSVSERTLASEFIRGFPDDLFKLNDICEFSLKLNSLFNKIKIRAFDSYSVTRDLRKYFERMLQEKKNLIEDVSRTLSIVIKEKFKYSSQGHLDLSSERKSEVYILESHIKEILLNTEYFSNEILVIKIIQNLEQYLEYKSSFIGEVLEKYYKDYTKTRDFKVLLELIEKVICDLIQDFIIEDSPITLIGVKKVTIEEFKKSLANHLNANKALTLREFTSFFESQLTELIKSSTNHFLKNLIAEPIQAYFGSLSTIKNIFNNDCSLTLRLIEDSLCYKILNIRMSELTIYDKGKQNSIELAVTIEQAQPLFKNVIKSESVSVNQIIGLDAGIYFAFISDFENGKTNVLRFNPCLKTRDDFEWCMNIEDPDVKIAGGSSAQCFIMFQNNKRIATLGGLKMNRYLEDRKQLDIYSKVGRVVSSYYIKDSMKLYIIDDSGLLFCKEKVNDDDATYIVTSHFKEKDSDKLEPLRPSKGQKFFNIHFSRNEGIFFLQSEVGISCYDTDFNQTHYTPITDEFLSFKNVIFSNQCFLLIQNKDFSIKCFKVKAPMQKNSIQENKEV